MGIANSKSKNRHKEAGVVGDSDGGDDDDSAHSSIKCTLFDLGQMSKYLSRTELDGRRFQDEGK